LYAASPNDTRLYLLSFFGYIFYATFFLLLYRASKCKVKSRI
jgi:hypothetical protein